MGCIHLNPCRVHAFQITFVVDFLAECALTKVAYGTSVVDMHLCRSTKSYSIVHFEIRLI